MCSDPGPHTGVGLLAETFFLNLVISSELPYDGLNKNTGKLKEFFFFSEALGSRVPDFCLCTWWIKKRKIILVVIYEALGSNNLSKTLFRYNIFPQPIRCNGCPIAVVNITY